MNKARNTKVLLKLMFVSYFIILCPLLGTSQLTETNEKLDSFLRIAEDLYHKTELPGVGMAIVYDGKVIYKGGFGFSNIEKKEPVTEHSLFFLGSTTKAFTGFAAAKLVEKKKLDWKTPIIEYHPEFSLSEPYVAKHVNLEDLFTHMTGLARRDDLCLGKSVTREQVYEQATQLPFSHSFRENWEYNNHAYVIIGKILEIVAETSWESIIRQEIFGPLEMNHSYVSFQEFVDDPMHVTGYSKDGKTILPHINVDNVGPAGSITSTPGDIAKWLQMLVNKGYYLGQQLITKEQYDYLMGPKGMSFTDTCSVRYYSIGWGGSQTYGARTLRHSGAIAGNSARVSFMPDQGFGIFIMTNQRSDYKAILTDYAESIFVNGDFKRDLDRERKVISYNRFIQFQNLLLDYGMDAAENYHAQLEFKDFEASMLVLGQSLLDAGYLDPALFVFKLNVADHPNSYQAYDRYAYALVKCKKKELAIKMYEKSMELNPKNQVTQKALKKLLKE